MTAYTTILFDLDATLFDFAACWEKGMQQTIATHPLTADLHHGKLLEALRRHGDRLWPEVVAKTYDFAQYRQLRLQRAMAEFEREIGLEEADDFQRQYQAACLDAVTPDHAVTDAISELSQRFTLGIVTNGPADMAFIKLDRLGLAPFFPQERVFISERIGFHKPDRRIFLAVLKHLHVPAEQVLFVGDSWEADVAGAMAVGMKAVWINPDGASPGKGDQPLAVIQRVDRLLEYV